MKTNAQPLIYQKNDGAIKADVWFIQEQMAILFGKGRSTVAEDIYNVYEEDELVQGSTCRKFRQFHQEGNGAEECGIDYRNLDGFFKSGNSILED
jgi:hypothetical protein